MTSCYVIEGSPRSKPSSLDAPFWKGLQNNVLKLQYWQSCSSWQWEPERICHPVNPELVQQGAYLIVLVEMPEAGNVRLIGTSVGDPHQSIYIVEEVVGFFEYHVGEQPSSLLNSALA